MKLETMHAYLSKNKGLGTRKGVEVLNIHYEPKFYGYVWFLKNLKKKCKRKKK